MISSLDISSFSQQQQQSNCFYNVFTPNVQIMNSVSSNKNFFKQNGKSQVEQQNQQNNLLPQQSQQTQLTFRTLPRTNSDSEVYEKSSENYFSHFSSLVNTNSSSPSGNSNQQQQSMQYAKSKSLKEEALGQLSPTLLSSALAQTLNKKLAKLAKKQSSLSSSSCSTQISSCHSFNTIPTTKITRPFPEHEFFLCADNMSRSTLTHIEDDDSFLLYPVIQVNAHSKNIQFVEYNKKKAVLSIHLQNKLSPSSSNTSIDSLSSISFEEVPSTPQYMSSELNNSISALQNDLKNVTKVSQKAALSYAAMENEIFKSMASFKQKACLTVAYKQEESGSFEVKGIHANEKFLIYTKWDTENCMMTTLNGSLQEMFTAKNYETFMTNTYKSMSCAFNNKNNTSFPFSGELRMSDNGVREVDMSVESSFNTQNGLLFVSYAIDKVISERKAAPPQQQKKKSNKSSIFSSSKQDKSITSGIRSQSSSIFKRKASNSFTFEETTLGNEEESLSQQEKVFLQRYYSL